MKKNLLKFFKTYFIVLFTSYFLFFLSFYILLNKNNLDSDIIIPNIALENQFKELKSIKDFKGKTLLVDFWFAGCTPCLNEMKYFPQLLKKYDSELAIMSISTDPKKHMNQILDSKNKPWHFLISDNINWTFYNDYTKEKLITPLNIHSYPTYLLFNKKGELLGSPSSGVFAIEKELGGIFGLDFTVEMNKKNLKKISILLIPFVLLLVLLIKLIIYLTKRIFKINTNANTV